MNGKPRFFSGQLRDGSPAIFVELPSGATEVVVSVASMQDRPYFGRKVIQVHDCTTRQAELASPADVLARGDENASSFLNTSRHCPIAEWVAQPSEI